MSDTPHLALPLIAAAQAQKHVTHNEALRILDALVQIGVKDRDLAAPPGAPAEGDRYIVAAGPTGAWASHAGDIAAWLDGAWTFFHPAEGWLAWVDDEDTLLIYNGAGWTPFGGGAVSEIQNLSLLGLGTTADATNPFSAKLNKALWTARTVAEGGTGDLRYTLNKESAAKVLSLLLQAGFSGRAEFGLIGDDNLTLKVSPDGAAWTTALVVDKSSGALKTVAGSAAAPAVGLGEAGTGLFRPAAGVLGLAQGGVEAGRLGAAGLALGSGFDATEALHVRRTGAAAARILLEGEGTVAPQFKRASADAVGPSFSLIKSRGTVAANAGVVQNDNLGTINFTMVSDIARVGGQIVGTVVAAAPATPDCESRFTFMLAGAGSTSVAEMLRLQQATGLSMYGANVVVDQNRHVRLRVYTVATLPAASAAAGQMIYCSDLGGGGGLLVSDGTGWRRTRETGTAKLTTNAAFTLTPLVDAPQQFHTGALTASRAVTLATSGAYDGCRFRLTRTGAGAFTLDVGTGPLKSLAQNSWGEFVYDGVTDLAWKLSAYGTL